MVTFSPNSDKGILMTFGNGVSGCLGYGDYDDAPEVCIDTVHVTGVGRGMCRSFQPKLVPAMLDYETTEVACGANHVIAVTGRVILKYAQQQTRLPPFPLPPPPTHSINVLCSSLHSKHTQYPSPTSDVQYSSTTKQMLIVVHGITIGQSPYLIFQHLFMDACSLD